MSNQQEIIDAARELVANIDHWEAAVGDIIGRDPRTGMCTARLKKALANQGKSPLPPAPPFPPVDIVQRGINVWPSLITVTFVFLVLACILSYGLWVTK